MRGIIAAGPIGELFYEFWELFIQLKKHVFSSTSRYDKNWANHGEKDFSLRELKFGSKIHKHI